VRQAQQPDTLITQVSVRPDHAGSDPAFDFELPLNPGFVAIVGNKGQGKSALVDTLALAANSDRQEEFSFLNTRRFLRDGGAVAARYRVGLRWADGQSTPRSLTDKHDTKLPSRVDYLPQSLIERVCAADPDSLEKRQFEAEIERVVFRHINEDERGDATSLRMYLGSKTVDIQRRLDDARADLRVAAERVVALQTREAELMGMGLEARHLSVSGQIVALDAELARQQAAIDLAQSARGEQGAQVTADLVAARAQHEQLLLQRAIAFGAAHKQRSIVTSGTLLANALQETVAQARTQALQLSLLIDANVGNAINVILQDNISQAWLVSQREESLLLQSRVDGPGGHTEQLEAVALKIHGLELSLAEQDEETAAALQALKDAQVRKEHLTGDPADATSLSGIEAMQDELRATPTNTAEARAALRDAFDDIHAEVLLLLAAQDTAYGAAARYVEQTSLLQDVGLDFGVELRVRGFKASWIGKVNRHRLTEFPGLETPDEVEDVLPALDMTSGPGLYEALAVIEDRLSRVRGAEAAAQRPLAQLMRTNFSAADLLASLYDLTWLQSQYVIRSQGLELRELSPGQRGLVLLMFYLLVDKSARPLLLDQPEENLDNQTVRAYLVPALRQAVQRRQVIAVTHNPNLAIVGDADQLIIAAHTDGKFSYSSGSLAHLAVGLGSIDVLEGTHAAFKNREWKYAQVVGQH